MKINQTSKRKNDRLWSWSISLAASNEELDQVDKVIYHLHPTFRKSEVVKTNRSRNFRLDASGWGTFVVRIEIFYNDGNTEELRHRLKFDHERPKVFLSYPGAGSETDEVVQTLKNEAERLGWDITSAEEINLGEDWDYALNKQIDDAQLYVLVGDETPSRYVMEEIRTARELGKPVIALDKDNLYGRIENQQVTSGDELVNSFKAIDFSIRVESNWFRGLQLSGYCKIMRNYFSLQKSCPFTQAYKVQLRRQARYPCKRLSSTIGFSEKSRLFFMYTFFNQRKSKVTVPFIRDLGCPKATSTNQANISILLGIRTRILQRMRSNRETGASVRPDCPVVTGGHIDMVDTKE